MNSKYLLIAMLTIFMIAVSGCTSPSPTASPSAAASPAPVETAAPSTAPAASPTEVAAPSPSPTPAPVYASGSPISVSNIKISWDTTKFTGQASETATMTVMNTKNDSVAVGVVVDYVVSTPAMYAGPGGQAGNYTSNITKTANIGMMQPGEQKDISFQVDHPKNVPATVSVTVQWRGGSSVLFEKTLDLPDNKFGTYEF